MEESLIFNQHLAKNKTTFSRFTQHSVSTSYPLQGAGMAELRDSKSGTMRLYWKRRTESPASCGRCHSLQGLDVSTSQSRFHSSLPNPREPGYFVQGRIFKVSTISLLTISLQPGGQLILIDPKMFLLISEFHKHVRSLKCEFLLLVLLINQVLTPEIKPASKVSLYSLSAGDSILRGISELPNLKMRLLEWQHIMWPRGNLFPFSWDVCCIRSLRRTLSWLKESSGE